MYGCYCTYVVVYKGTLLCNAPYCTYRSSVCAGRLYRLVLCRCHTPACPRTDDTTEGPPNFEIDEPFTPMRLHFEIKFHLPTALSRKKSKRGYVTSKLRQIEEEDGPSPPTTPTVGVTTTEIRTACSLQSEEMSAHRPSRALSAGEIIIGPDQFPNDPGPDRTPNPWTVTDPEHEAQDRSSTHGSHEPNKDSDSENVGAEESKTSSNHESVRDFQSDKSPIHRNTEDHAPSESHA